MAVRIIYALAPWKSFSDLCEICGNDIEEGDTCYYHGDGMYTCSEKCKEELEE